MNHQPHPKCSLCFRALYKSGSKGAPVKKSDPWTYCRNSSCADFGSNAKPASAGGLPESAPVKEPKARVFRTLAEVALADVQAQEDARVVELLATEEQTWRAAAQELGSPAVFPASPTPTPPPMAIESAPPPPVVEPIPAESEYLVNARLRIRELLAKAFAQSPERSTVGIVLALVSQETGNHAAANALIAEYRLDLLGLLPQEVRKSEKD